MQFNLLCIEIFFQYLVIILDNSLCLCLDDYVAIGADEEELGSQIEEDILCV